MYINIQNSEKDGLLFDTDSDQKQISFLSLRKLIELPQNEIHYLLLNGVLLEYNNVRCLI